MGKKMEGKMNHAKKAKSLKNIIIFKKLFIVFILLIKFTNISCMLHQNKKPVQLQNNMQITGSSKVFCQSKLKKQKSKKQKFVGLKKLNCSVRPEESRRKFTITDENTYEKLKENKSKENLLEKNILEQDLPKQDLLDKDLPEKDVLDQDLFDKSIDQLDSEEKNCPDEQKPIEKKDSPDKQKFTKERSVESPENSPKKQEILEFPEKVNEKSIEIYVPESTPKRKSLKKTNSKKSVYDEQSSIGTLTPRNSLRSSLSSISSSQSLEKLSQNKRRPSAPKKNKNSVKNSDVDCKVHEVRNDSKKIIRRVLGIYGAITFLDIRNFTFFCNKSPDEIPAIFMAELTSCAEKIISEWAGQIISVPGDAYVAIFPKKKSELTLKESAISAILCSIELTMKMSKTMEESKKRLQKISKSSPYPERFDLGVETGTTQLYRLDKSKKVTPFASVSKTINNAQRLEDHSKKSKERKITISKKTYNLLSSYEKIRKLFFLESLLEEKGIERQFVHSCTLKGITAFYNSSEWLNYKERFKRKFRDSIPELCKSI